MRAYLRITVENQFDIEIPDGLSNEEAYNYILDNCQGDIDLAIQGGDFYMEVELPDEEEEED